MEKCEFLGCYEPQRIKTYCFYHHAVRQEQNEKRCQIRTNKYNRLLRKYNALEQKYKQAIALLQKNKIFI